MNLKSVYDDYFSGLHSRFNPKFVSLEERYGLVTLTVEETFQNHSLESRFVYIISNDGRIEPFHEDYDYDTESSEDSVYSFNSFDTSDHTEESVRKFILRKKDLDSRKWTYMVPLETSMMARPIAESQ
jgi:hypothetical protein